MAKPVRCKKANVSHVVGIGTTQLCHSPSASANSGMSVHSGLQPHLNYFT